MQGISVGVTQDFVKQHLGNPITVRALGQDIVYDTNETPAATEFTYRLPSAWLQTINAVDGTVLRYSVTITDRHARIRVGGQGYPNLAQGNLVLGRTRFAGIGNPDGSNVFAANTAASYYWERFYLGNPGGYLTYWLSYNDAGAPLIDLELFSELGALAPRFDSLSTCFDLSADDRTLVAFRERSRPNTYTVALRTCPAPEKLGETLGIVRTDVRILPNERRPARALRRWAPGRRSRR